LNKRERVIIDNAPRPGEVFEMMINIPPKRFEKNMNI
jgi:hypothetical protein